LNQSPSSTLSGPGTANSPFAVSIVVPVFNEEARVAQTLTEIASYFDDRAIPAQIIVADDGSSDDTVTIAREFAASHANVCVLNLPHGGKARAVLGGLAHASAPIAGFTDVDLATPLATYERCAEALTNGYDVAIASREGEQAQRVGEPTYRHVMGRVFNGLVRLLLLPGIDDTQCGFKFFSREALDDILTRSRLYRSDEVIERPRVTAFDVEILYIARAHGHRIAVIPVTWFYGQQSKVNPLLDTIQNFRDVLRVRWNGWLGRYR